MEFRVDTDADQGNDKKELRKQYIKLLKDIKNPKKKAWNPYTKTYYADLNSILDSIKEAQSNTDLAFFQDMSNDGNYIVCQSYFISESGEIVFDPFKINAGKADSQSMGSAETYARRYDAQSCVSINGELDDDGNKSSGRNSRSNNYHRNYQSRSNYQSKGNYQNNSQLNTQQATQKQLDLMNSLAQKIGDMKEISSRSIGNQALKEAHVKDSSHITYREAHEVVQNLTDDLTNLTNRKEAQQ